LPALLAIAEPLPNILKKEKKTKLSDKIAAIVIIGALIWAIGYGYLNSKDIDDNRTFTKGEITGIKHIRKSKYLIEYKYSVEGKKFNGTVGVNYFDCTTENNCIGYKIDVFFSSKNPENSQAFLKKYDEHRTQVYFP